MPRMIVLSFTVTEGDLKWNEIAFGIMLPLKWMASDGLASLRLGDTFMP